MVLDADAQARAQAILRSLGVQQARNIMSGGALTEAHLAGLLAGNVDAAQLVNSIVNGTVMPGLPGPGQRPLNRFVYHPLTSLAMCYMLREIPTILCWLAPDRAVLPWQAGWQPRRSWWWPIQGKWWNGQRPRGNKDRTPNFRGQAQQGNHRE
jgi:hypothetical protein